MTENGDNRAQVLANQGECPRVNQLSQRELDPSTIFESPVGHPQVATPVQGPAFMLIILANLMNKSHALAKGTLQSSPRL